MKFRNSGLDTAKLFYVFKPHQIKAILDSNIKFDDYPTLFSGVSKLSDSDIIDIAVTQYSAEIKLGIKEHDHLKNPKDDVTAVKITNAIGKVSRFDAIKDINSSTKFYVRRHPNGFELVFGKLGDANEDGALPEAVTECIGGWVCLDEPDFNTALLAAIYHAFGYHTVHFKDTIGEVNGDEFTLADVFKLIV